MLLSKLDHGGSGFFLFGMERTRSRLTKYFASFLAKFQVVSKFCTCFCNSFLVTKTTPGSAVPAAHASAFLVLTRAKQFARFVPT